MNRTVLLIVVALVPALVVGGAGYVAGRLTPGHPTATVTPALGTIVSRTIELKVNGTDAWQPVEPRATAVVTAADVEKSITAAQSAGTNFLLNVRYRLTVRDATTSAPYDVQVRGTCFDAVSVGGPWPNSVDACR
jgi:hypothetical protein